MRLSVFAVAVLLILPVAGFAQNQPAQLQNPEAFHIGHEDMTRFNALSPADQQKAIQEAQQKWAQMKEGDKKKLQDQIRADFDKLTPQEKQAAQQQAAAKWQSMTPEQQTQMRNEFPDLLKGNMQR